MITHIKAARSLKGHIPLPPSKSYSIRSFIIASQGGRSQILSASDCDDAKIALSVAKQLGSKVSRHRRGHWTIEANRINRRVGEIKVGESGTVLRFLLPLLSLKGKAVKVIGQGTLRGRPNKHLLQSLRRQGLRIKGTGPGESIPIKYSGGKMTGGRVTIDGSLSSQFISALLIMCPSLDTNSVLIIKGKKLVSQDYITMTDQILKLSGVKIKRIGIRKILIKGKQNFKGLRNFKSPSDFGLAAYFIAAAALVKSQLILDGYLNEKLIQADGQIFQLARKMGIRFKKNDKMIKIRGPHSLRGGSFSLKNSPDLVPIMAVLALFAKGKTRIHGIGHARVKESDRISDLRKELLKIGAKITEKRDEITIFPQKQYKMNVLLNSHEDHRLAMAFSILGLKIGTRVTNIKCVSKSYPGFVKDLKSIRH